MKTTRILAALLFLATVTLASGCEPAEPYETQGGLTFDVSCSQHLTTLKKAISYIVDHKGRMTYHGSAVADIVAGNSYKLTIKCRELGPNDVGSFGQAWRPKGSDNAYIEINSDSVLGSKWYHPLFAKPGYSGKEVFTAGILAHEATHVWDFFNIEGCSKEEKPTYNQYLLWQFGGLISNAIACYDSTGRGCGEEDDHLVSALECVFD